MWVLGHFLIFMHMEIMTTQSMMSGEEHMNQADLRMCFVGCRAFAELLLPFWLCQCWLVILSSVFCGCVNTNFYLEPPFPPTMLSLNGFYMLHGMFTTCIYIMWSVYTVCVYTVSEWIDTVYLVMQLCGGEWKPTLKAVYWFCTNIKGSFWVKRWHAQRI